MLRERGLSEVHREGGGDLPVVDEEEDGGAGPARDSACFHFRSERFLTRGRHPLRHH